MTADELLEDPDGAPYPEEIQTIVRKILDEALDLGSEVIALVDLIEAASRLAQPDLGPTDEATRDERILDLFLAGFVAGEVHGLTRAGVHPAAAYADAEHTAYHLADDPIARAQLIESLLVKWLTGQTPPMTYVTAYGTHHPHD
jgi:hypothetical protein